MKLIMTLSRYVYCETCEKLICRDCTISQCHQNHKYKLVTECYRDHHQEIEVNLTTVKRKVLDIDTALTNLFTQERQVTKQGEDLNKEISTQAQLIINLVQQSETVTSTGRHCSSTEDSISNQTERRGRDSPEPAEGLRGICRR